MSIRTLRRLLPAIEYQCIRCLSTTTPLQSGHSRWSKIKHDKGAVDAKRNVLFSAFAKELTDASRSMFVTLIDVLPY